MAPGTEACWNDIGVQGNRACPKLEAVIHCRNCPVYSRAGLQLLDRPLLPEYRRAWTEHFAQKKALAAPAKTSALLFRISSEWFALPTPAFQEVAERRLVHSLPHRRQGIVLGLVNVRGELLICVSLAHLLGLDQSRRHASQHPTYDRLLVTQWDGHHFVFPANEVRGVHRFQAPELTGAAGHAGEEQGSPIPRHPLVAGPGGGFAGRRAALLIPESEPPVTQPNPDAPSLPMLELFRVEAENQAAVLTSGLLELERDPGHWGRWSPHAGGPLAQRGGAHRQSPGRRARGSFHGGLFCPGASGKAHAGPAGD